MFRRSLWCVVVLAVLLVPRTGASARSSVQDDEVRGLWVLRSSLTTPEKIDELVRLAGAGGYNTLLVQVRGRGDAYYTSQIEPRAEELRRAPADFDPLAHTISRAHAAGLRVHAWFNVNLVASAVTLPSDPRHIIRRHPEWVMVPQALGARLATRSSTAPAYLADIARWSRQQGDHVEGLYLSPITDGAQDYTVSVIADLLSRYALDGLHLDYIRFPTPAFDTSALSLQAFTQHHASRVSPQDRARLDARVAADPLIWVRTFPDAWEQFRRDRLTRLVERIRDLATGARPVTLSAAVLPDPADARQRKLQDWSLWAQRGWLDAICPMAYATDNAGFRRQIDTTMAGASGTAVWAGIGAWRLPAARTATAIRDARDRNASGILLFSYDSLVGVGPRRGSYFASLRSVVAPNTP